MQIHIFITFNKLHLILKQFRDLNLLLSAWKCFWFHFYRIISRTLDRCNDDAFIKPATRNKLYTFNWFIWLAVVLCEIYTESLIPTTFSTKWISLFIFNFIFGVNNPIVHCNAQHLCGRSVFYLGNLNMNCAFIIWVYNSELCFYYLCHTAISNVRNFAAGKFSDTNINCKQVNSSVLNVRLKRKGRGWNYLTVDIILLWQWTAKEKNHRMEIIVKQRRIMFFFFRVKEPWTSCVLISIL